jgi:mercuric ion transport protein
MRYLMAAIAAITCPCHLPIAAALLAGTTLGAALTEHLAVALMLSTVLFAGSAWAAIRLFSAPGIGGGRGSGVHEPAWLIATRGGLEGMTERTVTDGPPGRPRHHRR